MGLKIRKFVSDDNTFRRYCGAKSIQWRSVESLINLSKIFSFQCVIFATFNSEKWACGTNSISLSDGVGKVRLKSALSELTILFRCCA